MINKSLRRSLLTRNIKVRACAGLFNFALPGHLGLSKIAYVILAGVPTVHRRSAGWA